jgi:lactoylglutathione lyase
MKMISRFAIILSIFHLNNVYSQEFTISKTDHLAYEVRDLNKVGDFFLNIFKFEEIEIDNPSLRWFDIGDGFEIHLGENKEANHEKIKANHLAVTIDNLEIFMEYLKSNDIYFESWDGKKLQYNIRPNDNAFQIYLTDPEGNWIEVNQRK